MRTSLCITAFVPFPVRYPTAPDHLLLPDNSVGTNLQSASRLKIKLVCNFINPTFPFPQLPPLALPDARRAHFAPRHVSKSIKSSGYGNPEPQNEQESLRTSPLNGLAEKWSVDIRQQTTGEQATGEQTTDEQATGEQASGEQATVATGNW